MCVIAFVCGVSCHNTNGYEGQFHYILVGEDANCYNYVFQSTIAYCNGNENACSTLFNRYGKINIKTVNSSFNTCAYDCGLDLWNPTGTSSEQPTEVYFSSFRKNTANNYGCLAFASGTFKLVSSNIIENKQTGTDLGTVYTWSSAKLTVNECCLVGNTGAPLFYIGSGSISG